MHNVGSMPLQHSARLTCTHTCICRPVNTQSRWFTSDVREQAQYAPYRRHQDHRQSSPQPRWAKMSVLLCKDEAACSTGEAVPDPSTRGRRLKVLPCRRLGLTCVLLLAFHAVKPVFGPSYRHCGKTVCAGSGLQCCLVVVETRSADTIM